MYSPPELNSTSNHHITSHLNSPLKHTCMSKAASRETGVDWSLRFITTQILHFDLIDRIKDVSQYVC